MSEFNKERKMQYVAEMSESDKITFLQALVRLAKADGNFDED